MASLSDYINDPENNKKILGGLCSLTVSFTFCLHFFVAKDVMKGGVPPIVLGGSRGLLGGLLLFAIYYANLKGSFTLKSMKMLLSIAFFGYFINQILFLNGLKLSSPLNTGVIMNTIPVVAALISMLFRVESFAWKKIAGCILGFSMILWLTLSTSEGQLEAKVGDLFIFISVITLCISTVLTKTLVRTGFPSPIISASMLFFGGLGLCILTMTTEKIGNLQVGKIESIITYASESTLNLARIIFEIVISTALTYLLSFKALKYLAPSQSMIFIYLQPLIIAGIDFLIYTKSPPLVLIPVLVGVVYSGYLVMSTDSR
jgi:drug/metabolite transporter (DMT)-like permease